MQVPFESGLNELSARAAEDSGFRLELVKKHSLGKPFELQPNFQSGESLPRGLKLFKKFYGHLSESRRGRRLRSVFGRNHSRKREGFREQDIEAGVITVPDALVPRDAFVLADTHDEAVHGLTPVVAAEGAEATNEPTAGAFEDPSLLVGPPHSRETGAAERRE